MYSINLAETSQIHTLIGQSLMRVLKIRLYEIIVCSCIIYQILIGTYKFM